MRQVRIGKTLPIVGVWWHDTTAYESWDTTPEVALCVQFSVGMLVRQDDKKVTILRTGSLGGENEAFEGRLGIPAGAVIKIVRLGTSEVPKPTKLDEE